MNLAKYFRGVIRNEVLAIRTRSEARRHHFEAISELHGDITDRPFAVRIRGRLRKPLVASGLCAADNHFASFGVLCPEYKVARGDLLGEEPVVTDNHYGTGEM